MAVDENNVRNLIVLTLAKHPSVGCCDGVCAAWQELYDVRNYSSSPYDAKELAIAEHYLFARCRVCSGEVSVDQMKAMVKVYTGMKKVGPLRDLLKSNPQIPTAPPSEEEIVWGLLGATDGEADRMRCNRTKSPPVVTVPKFFKKKYGF